MSYKVAVLTTWLAAGVLIALVGCGTRGPAAVKTDFVEGVVTLDGEPVQGATVTFIPVQEGVGASATGMTDATGKYHLTAVGAGIGAQAGAGTLPGEYYVGVLKDMFTEIPEEGGKEDEARVDTPDFATDQPSHEPVVTHVVPQRLNDPRQSNIKVTVKAGNNDIPIELKSK